MLVPTLVPASRQILAAADSSAYPRRPNTPASAQAGWWWPRTSRGRPHRQLREEGGRGSQRRRRSKMRNWEVEPRHHVGREALPTTGPLGKATWPAQWGSTVDNMSVHCVSGCLLPPKQWHSDLSVLHIGHRRSPTCCHTLPRRSHETQAHQLLRCCTRCGNMETSCVPV